MNDDEIARRYVGMQLNMLRTVERVAHETIIKVSDIPREPVKLREDVYFTLTHADDPPA